MAAMILAATAAFGQVAGPPPAAEDIVTIKVSGAETKAGQPGLFSVFLEISVKPGFHINSDQPGDEYSFPARVELMPFQGLELEKVVFPAGHKVLLPFSEGPVSVLEGDFKVELKFKVAPSAGLDLKIQGKLKFQACNDQACLPPRDVSFERKISLKTTGPKGL